MTTDLLRAWAAMPGPFDRGLSESELEAFQAEHNLIFPCDLRECLASALPAGKRFANWRDRDEIASRLAWPWHGVAFDIEHNEYWLPLWGPAPPTLEARLAIAKDHVARLPRLIPIFGHRYLAAVTPEAGNQVLSVHQTDIIGYGPNLLAYIQGEFHGADVDTTNNVPGWKEVAERGERVPF